MELKALAAREEWRQEFVETRRLIDETNRSLGERIDETNRSLGARIDETNRQMRVLHEDIVDRIKTLGEQLNGSHPPKSRRRGSS